MCNDGILTDGLVDATYTGSVRVALFNLSHKYKIFEKGDKIAQIVILPALTPEFVEVDSIDGGERGSNGLGSTGR